MRHFIRRHHISFINAWNGLKWAFTTQPNFRVHTTLASVAVLCGYLFQISGVEFVLIIFAIVLGLGTEMVNTALESMTDLITTEYKEQAKIAKDVAAGMMLLTAIGTFIVACLIFLPRIYILMLA